MKTTKKQSREKQKLEEKVFKKNMIIILLIIFLIMMSANIFIGHWCEVKYIFRKFTSYGREIPASMICMQGNRLLQHKNVEFKVDEFTFYTCEGKCKRAVQNHFNELAFATDAFSGDTICKANAVVGLREKGKPNLIYFKNIKNLNKYYATKTIK